MLRDQLVSHSGTCRRRFVRADYDAGDQCQVRRIIRFPVTFFPPARASHVCCGSWWGPSDRVLPYLTPFEIELGSVLLCSPHHLYVVLS
jgi:hypothetical protein